MEIKRKNQKESLINTPSLISYCPFCNTSFHPSEAAIICDEGSIQLLFVACNYCQSSLVVLLVLNEMGINSVGLVTDLTADDVARFQSGQAITADDLLAVHEWLNNGSGL